MENILWRIFEGMPLDVSHRILFQQDGVPEHKLEVSCERLNATHPRRGGQTLCSRRLPNLNPIGSTFYDYRSYRSKISGSWDNVWCQRITAYSRECGAAPYRLPGNGWKSLLTPTETTRRSWFNHFISYATRRKRTSLKLNCSGHVFCKTFPFF
jgi:hypothetical protein